MRKLALLTVLFSIGMSIHVYSQDILYTIEAENFDQTGGTHNDTYAGGPGYGVLNAGSKINFVNTGDWAEYQIDLAVGGKYKFEYQISTPCNDAQIQLQIDGNTISIDDVENNGAWDNYYTLTAATRIVLSSGAHTVRIVASGANAWQWNLDKVVCTLVNDIPVQEVILSESAIELTEGDSRTLNVSILPENATNKAVYWSVNNTYVASVSQTGLVQAEHAGEAIIIARALDGGFMDTCIVNVLPANNIVFEAEAFNTTGGTYNDSYAGGPGLGVNSTGNNINYVNSGDWVEYQFNFTDYGMYEIDYNISTPMANAQIQLEIDGQIVSTDNVVSNGEWDNYEVQTAINAVSLIPGSHTIRIEATGTNAWQWNLDKITLREITDDSDECTPWTMEQITLQNSNNTWSSGLIDISCFSAANIDFTISGCDNIEPTDLIKVSYIIDGGQEIVLCNESANLPNIEYSYNIGCGTSAEIFIESTTALAQSQYYVRDIKVSDNNKACYAPVGGGITGSSSGGCPPSGDCGSWSAASTLSLSNSNNSWSSGSIDISCNNGSAIDFSIGGCENVGTLDRIAVSYKINGGTEVELCNESAALPNIEYSYNIECGDNVEILIRSTNGLDEGKYYVSGLSVNNSDMGCHSTGGGITGSSSGGCEPYAAGNTVWLKASNGSYVSASGNINTMYPLQANSSVISSSEKFDVLKVGTEYVALRSNANGKYISVNTASLNNPLEATQTTISDNEQFTWEFASGSNIALKAKVNGNYVSADDSQTGSPLLCNSSSIGDAEQFSYEFIAKSDAVRSLEPSAGSIAIYPNPANDKLFVSSSSELGNGSYLTIYNQLGSLLISEQISGFSHQVSLSSLASGMYIIRLVDGAKFYNKQFIKE